MATELSTEDEFNQFVQARKFSLVHFSAKWSEACQQLNSFLVELKDELKCFDYGVVEADESPLITCAFSVDAAPTVVFFEKDKEVDRLKGFDPGELKQKIMQHNFVEGVAAMTREAEDENEKEVLNSKLKALINRAPLMLFMKGTPDFPKCGFSNQMVNVLREVGASFVSFDVLENEEVRQGLKKYSQWPTYPQLYLHGELIGGLDIVKECVKDADFCEKLPKVKDLQERLKKLIHQAPLMLFMKGNANAPQCKYSRMMIELLNNISASYSTFDILTDAEVRQGLKEYSKWPTYPQLYLNGELIGGVDVVTEELKNPDFVAKLPKTSSG